MTVPFPVGDVKIVSSISIFVLVNTLTFKIKGLFFGTQGSDAFARREITTDVFCRVFPISCLFPLAKFQKENPTATI